MTDSSPSGSTDDIRIEMDIPAAPEASFRCFTEEMNRWWPQQYTWSGEVLEWIGLEGQKGGRCTERGPDGFQCDWGRVLEWEPARRLLLCWQIGPGRIPQPNPDRSSEVELQFDSSGDGTILTLTHRHFDRHGEKASTYRAGMASSQGWPFILDRFKETLTSGG